MDSFQFYWTTYNFHMGMWITHFTPPIKYLTLKNVVCLWNDHYIYSSAVEMLIVKDELQNCGIRLHLFMQIIVCTTVFLDIIYFLAFYLKHTTFQRLDSVSLFRWSLLSWAQSTERPYLETPASTQARILNEAQHKPSTRVKTNIKNIKEELHIWGLAPMSMHFFMVVVVNIAPVSRHYFMAIVKMWF
jgi:hypothetical protein